MNRQTKGQTKERKESRHTDGRKGKIQKTKRHTEIKNTHADVQTDRRADRWTYRQTDRGQTDRQTYRQTDRQTGGIYSEMYL
mgnify:CR=1 FL=1